MEELLQQLQSRKAEFLVQQEAGEKVRTKQIAQLDMDIAAVISAMSEKLRSVSQSVG